jgi:hypothetical protein
VGHRVSRVIHTAYRIMVGGGQVKYGFGMSDIPDKTPENIRYIHIRDCWHFVHNIEVLGPHAWDPWGPTGLAYENAHMWVFLLICGIIYLIKIEP